jgi:hypothetical protein
MVTESIHLNGEWKENQTDPATGLMRKEVSWSLCSLAMSNLLKKENLKY